MILDQGITHRYSYILSRDKISRSIRHNGALDIQFTVTEMIGTTVGAHRDSEDKVPRKCLYRTITYLRYGDENRYKDVKKVMLIALDANKDAYSRLFDFDTVNLEKDIKAGLDAKCNTLPVWFKTPKCAQFVADAHDLPVCIYNESSFTSFADEPFTCLPLKAPVKLKVKVQPFILQNSLNVHWLLLNQAIYNLSILPSKSCILMSTKPILLFLKDHRGVTNSYTRSSLSLWAPIMVPKKYMLIQNIQFFVLNLLHILVKKKIKMDSSKLLVEVKTIYNQVMGMDISLEAHVLSLNTAGDHLYIVSSIESYILPLTASQFKTRSKSTIGNPPDPKHYTLNTADTIKQGLNDKKIRNKSMKRKMREDANQEEASLPPKRKLISIWRHKKNAKNQVESHSLYLIILCSL
ncbi:hypothetical protein BDF21DRAFT_402700 [Thamnidium elegans]|nr:hypothetical protein BDF21DRAFT_402700 [Thamnidium elegans]